MAESPYKALSLSLIHQGKVRDIYDIDEHHMLIVATDRLSAFDVIFDQPIPDKGKILTSIANFWFDKTSHIIQNHLTGLSLAEILSAAEAETIFVLIYTSLECCTSIQNKSFPSFLG